MLCLQLGKSARNQGEGFVPTRLAERFAFANEWRREPVFTVDVAPTEFPLYTSGYSVGGPVFRRNFKDVAIFGPNVETATHTAVSANRFGLADAVLAHLRLRLRYLEDRSVPGLRFNSLDHIDHSFERRLLDRREESSVPQHGFFHQRITRANRYAMAARHAARFPNGRAAVPQHARIRVFPIDG